MCKPNLSLLVVDKVGEGCVGSALVMSHHWYNDLGSICQIYLQTERERGH